MDSKFVDGSRLFYGQMPGQKNNSKPSFEVNDIVVYQDNEYYIKEVKKTKLLLDNGSEVPIDQVKFKRRVYK